MDKGIIRNRVNALTRPNFQNRRPFAERIQEMIEEGCVNDFFLEKAFQWSTWELTRHYGPQCPDRDRAPSDMDKLPKLLQWIIDYAEEFLALDVDRIGLLERFCQPQYHEQMGYGEGAVARKIAAIFQAKLICSVPLLQFLNEQKNVMAVWDLIVDPSVDHFEWMVTLDKIGWKRNQIVGVATEKISQSPGQAACWFRPCESWDWTDSTEFAQLAGKALATGVSVEAEQLGFLYMHLACQEQIEGAGEMNWNYGGYKKFAEQVVTTEAAQALNKAVAGNLQRIFVDADDYSDWVWLVQFLGGLSLKQRIILSRTIELEKPGIWILTETLHALGGKDRRGQALLAYLCCQINQENGCRILKDVLLPTQPAHRDKINPATKAWFYQSLKDNLRQKGWYFTQIQISDRHRARHKGEGYKREAVVHLPEKKVVVWVNVDQGNHSVREEQAVLVPTKPRQSDRVIYEGDRAVVCLLDLREHVLRQPSPAHIIQPRVISEFTLVRHHDFKDNPDTNNIKVIDDGQMMWVEYRDRTSDHGWRRRNPELVGEEYPLEELHELLFKWATRDRDWRQVCDRHGRFRLSEKRWVLLNSATVNVRPGERTNEFLASVTGGPLNGFEIKTSLR